MKQVRILIHFASASEAQITIVALHLALLTLQSVLNSMNGWGKIRGVWCKGAQCSVMVELKQLRFSSLKYLILTYFSLEYKEVL